MNIGNRQAQGLETGTLIKAIIVALVVIIAIIAVYKSGIISYFINLPDLSQSEEGRQIISEQASVLPEEKNVNGLTYYPTIRLYYKYFGTNDIFAFRWNRGLGKIQVYMIIQNAQGSEWLLSPGLNDAFRNGRGVNSVQQSYIEQIMRAADEKEMIRRIAELSKDKEAYIDIAPTSSGVKNILPADYYSEEMSESELMNKLILLFPDFYKQEAVELKNKGELFSSEMEIFLDAGIWDSEDSVAVRWNFAKQKPEIKIRPNGGKILENGNEIWIDKKEDVRTILKKYDRIGAIYDSDKYPYLRNIENLLAAGKPSELSQKIKILLDLDGTRTFSNNNLNLIDINGRLYGYQTKNQDDLSAK